MENLTYQDILRNPDLLDDLVRSAHRERSKAIGSAIAAAFRALFFRPRRPAARSPLQTSGCG
jgi:hypothetical protein